MDIAWLQSFLALIEHGGFTAAAQAQRLSQPAFSRRIRSLERWVGTELIDRATHPLTLTAAGENLRVQANQALTGLFGVRDQVRSAQLTPEQAVRIGCGHTLATHFFPRWWHRFAAAEHCVLVAANTLDAYDSLLHGGCDLLLAHADPGSPLGVEHELDWRVLATDRLAPYARDGGSGPEFALPGSAGAPVPFVSHGPGAFLGRITDRLLGAEHAFLRPVVQSDLTGTLAELSASGLGIAWLPEIVAAGYPELTELHGASTELEIRLYRTRKPLPEQAARVWLATADSS
ncbi:LysR family transcriptional regulator [Sciscionella sediminilitoris]|uniref:LysR family transcriptional regulator n=1 Tax=Sciscionella sediminilitoris TaxID=1445613 RepID=UPI0004DF99F8|nr:LysR family transcriptional regulator [Sciscionella sp. SE31]